MRSYSTYLLLFLFILVFSCKEKEALTKQDHSREKQHPANSILGKIYNYNHENGLPKGYQVKSSSDIWMGLDEDYTITLAIREDTALVYARRQISAGRNGTYKLLDTLLIHPFDLEKFEFSAWNCRLKRPGLGNYAALFLRTDSAILTKPVRAWELKMPEAQFEEILPDSIVCESSEFKGVSTDSNNP